MRAEPASNRMWERRCGRASRSAPPPGMKTQRRQTTQRRKHREIRPLPVSALCEPSSVFSEPSEFFPKRKSHRNPESQRKAYSVSPCLCGRSTLCSLTYLCFDLIYHEYLNITCVIRMNPLCATILPNAALP
jgi:hypothetical protein